MPLPARRQSGFSLLELVFALLVAAILMAVALPVLLRGYRSYQLTNAARQMAEILRLTRYEAIRLNKPVSCVISTSAGPPGMTAVWADSNGNSTMDPTEKRILLGNAGNLVDSGTAGVPAIPTLMSAATIGTMPTQSWPSAPLLVFDARGAVTPPTSINVFYLASSAAPEAGFRAVLLMPAGSLQVWSADTTGNWQELR